MSEITITGMSDLQKALDQLPAKIEANILRGALRAGAKVQLAAAQRMAPVGPPSSEGKKLFGGYAGALRDSMRISTRSRRGVIKAVVTAGGKSKKTGADVFYAHMVEFGTARHFIKAKAAASLFFAGLFGDVVDHPGARKRPFMRPAFDATLGPATQAVADYIRKRLATKYGIDVPGPENT